MEVDTEGMIKLEVLDDFDPSPNETKVISSSHTDNMKYLNSLVSEAKQMSAKALEVSKLLFIAGDPLCGDVNMKSLQSALFSATESLTFSISILLNTLPHTHSIIKTDSSKNSQKKQQPEGRPCEVRLSKIKYQTEAPNQDTSGRIKEEAKQAEENQDFDDSFDYNGNDDDDDYNPHDDEDCNGNLDDGDDGFESDHDVKDEKEGIRLKSPVSTQTLQDPLVETYPPPSSEEEGKFKCSRCDYKTDTDFYLTDHMQGGLKFEKCPFCNVHVANPRRWVKGSKKNEEMMEEHFQNFHPQLFSSSGFKCLYCDKVCKKIWLMKNHLDKAHNLNLHPHCPHCDKVSTSSVISMRGHIWKNHKGSFTTEKPKVKKEPSKLEVPLCSFCGKSFKTRKLLRDHIKNLHAEVKLSCEDCDYVTGSLHILNRHRKKRHLGAEWILCGQCDLKFNTIKELTDHVYPAHGGHKHRCDQCTYSTYVPGKLRDHMTLRHSKGEEVFSCDQCEFKSTLEKYLVRHMKIHVTRLACEEPGCDYVCSKKSALKVHQESAHDGVRHSCEECGLTYRQRSSLTYHIRLVHKENTSYNCPDCDYVTRYKKNFSKHYESAHEGKKYPCKHGCEYVANTYASLLDHNAKLHSNKNYKCSLCSYSNHRKFRLQRHLKNVHKISKQEIKEK